jgi:hypothetical protein
MKDPHGKRRASILFDKQKRCCRCFLVSIQIINHLVLFFMMTCVVVHPQSQGLKHDKLDKLFWGKPMFQIKLSDLICTISEDPFLLGILTRL